MNSALLPFAVTVTLLYLGVGLLPFDSSGITWNQAFGLLPEQFGVGEAILPPLLLAAPLGFFWLGALWPRRASMRPAVASVLFLVLMLLAWLLQLGQVFFPPRIATPTGLLAASLGFVTGIALWWSLGSTLGKSMSGWPHRIWPWLVLLAGLTVLIPLNLEMPLNSPALTETLALSDIPQRLYLLIKTSFLWIPAGYLFVLSGYGSALPRWGIALVVALLLEGVPLLGEMPLKDTLELLFALPGIWVGAWLCERSPLPQGVSNRLRTAPVPAVTAPASEPSPERLPATDVMLPPFDALPVTASVSADSPGTLPEPSARRSHRSTAESTRHAHPLRWLAGLLLLLPALAGVVVFPLGQLVLAIAMLAYATLLWLRPNAWLVIVPAALPLLDLAPWTGRFFFDEFDLLLLVTAGTLYLRGRRWPGLGLTPVWPLLTLFSAGLLVSLLQGLGSPPPLDANAFSSYWSQYNSLRVIKGFIWGGLVFALLRLTRPQPAQLARLLAIGMGLGLLGVGLVGLWERWLFAGFADSHQTYRIVSTFSSMHTGGGHIEAYLAAALPFLWLGLAHWRSALLAVPVMLLTMYVTVFTVARGGVLALGVVLVVLAAASLRQAWRSGRRLQAAIPVGVMAILAAVLLVGIGGGYFQQRLAQTGEDWQIRMNHWQLALGMMDDSPVAQLFGMGLGSFPRVYLERGPADKQSATYGFTSDGNNTYLRLGTGDTVYYAQRVAVRAGESYHLELEVRSGAAEARISVPVCEKQLLNSRNCVWSEFTVPGDGRWHRLSRDFSSGQVGVEDGLKRPPVELYLHHPGQGSVVDVDNLRLLDSRGNNLVGNGGFSMGGDYWFFKTHSHLPWHIKNFWVHLLFEQGWVGLLLFTGLILFALARLGRVAWRGEPLAWVWLASILGMLTVGMFDSLVDTPRLATLLVAFSLLGAGHDWSDPGRPLRRRRSAPRPSSEDA